MATYDIFGITLIFTILLISCLILKIDRNLQLPPKCGISFTCLKILRFIIVFKVYNSYLICIINYMLIYAIYLLFLENWYLFPH